MSGHSESHQEPEDHLDEAPPAPITTPELAPAGHYLTFGQIVEHAYNNRREWVGRPRQCGMSTCLHPFAPLDVPPLRLPYEFQGSSSRSVLPLDNFNDYYPADHCNKLESRGTQTIVNAAHRRPTDQSDHQCKVDMPLYGRISHGYHDRIMPFRHSTHEDNDHLDNPQP